jgi:hypothetical protein
VVWEDFLDAMSHTRLQDEYNRAIRECDLFVMLFWTKVGQYTEEEFETAFGQFRATSKPFIFTYFKDAKISGSKASADKQDLTGLRAFQERFSALGHFYSTYKNTDELRYQLSQQLDKLAASGFVEFERPAGESAPSYQATAAGSGAIAQGPGSVAVGGGGVFVGGKNTGSINTGTQIDTGGGAYFAGPVSAGGDVTGRDQVITQGVSGRTLESLFATLLATVAQQASADQKAFAVQQV